MGFGTILSAGSKLMSGGAIAGATEGIKIIGGIAQALAGRRILRKTKLPEYEIASELPKNVALAQTVKNSGMAPEVYGRASNNIQRNMNFGIKALGDRRGVLAGISGIVGRSNDAYGDLAAKDAEIRNRNLVSGTQMEMGANAQLANQKNMKMKWEKLDPYTRRIDSGQALLGAGMQNIFGGLSGLGNVAIKSAYPNAGYGAQAPAQQTNNGK